MYRCTPLLGLFLLALTWLVELSYGFSYAIASDFSKIYWVFPTIILIIISIISIFSPNYIFLPFSTKYAPIYGALFVSMFLDLYFSYSLKLVVFVTLSISGAIFIMHRRVTEEFVYDLALALTTLWVSYQGLQGNWQQIGGDLLPIINAADLAFLAGGDPYAANYGAVTNNPFFYLPLQWLAYVPLAGLGVDLRLLNVAALIGVVASVRIALHRLPYALFQARWLFFPILLSNIFVRAIGRTYIFPYAVVLAALVWLLITRRDRWAGLLLGVALAARQTAIALALMVFAGCIRFLSARGLATLGGIVLAVLVVALGPFLVWHPHFLRECYLTLPRIALEHNAGNGLASNTMGIAPILRFFNITPPFGLQAAVMLLASVPLAVRRHDNRVRLGLALGAMDMLVAVSGGQVFEYYFCPGLLMMATSLMLNPQTLQPSPTAASTQPACTTDHFAPSAPHAEHLHQQS